MRRSGLSTSPRATKEGFPNGRLLLLLILILALVGITTLGILRDINSQSVVAIYAAIIGGAIGQANGYRQGRSSGERDRLIAEIIRRRAGS